MSAPGRIVAGRWSRPPRLLSEQAGTTLVEVLTGLGISALLIGFVGTVLFQLYRATVWGNNRMLLAADVQSAQLWLGRDTVQATSFTPAGAPNYGVFSLPTDSTTRQVRYSYDSANHTLVRTDLVTSQSVVAARDIAAQTDVTFSTTANLVMVSITANRAGLSTSASLYYFMRVP